ncbi:toxin YdaT family protein, partial [Streptomyces sp. NPDC047968]
MEINIKHEQIREALRGWAIETTQRTVAAEITRAYFDLQLQAPLLAQIERADGSVDDAAWHNNKQQIFRWLDGDSVAARSKIQQLQPA